jgi:hypothetical protein
VKQKFNKKINDKNDITIRTIKEEKTAKQRGMFFCIRGFIRFILELFNQKAVDLF